MAYRTHTCWGLVRPFSVQEAQAALKEKSKNTDPVSYLAYRLDIRLVAFIHASTGLVQLLESIQLGARASFHDSISMRENQAENYAGKS